MINPLLSLDQWLASYSDGHICVACERLADAHGVFLNFINTLKNQNEGIALVIGPEGGFSEREHQIIRDNPKIIRISLGSTILRAETAAVVGLGCLQLIHHLRVG
jgi:16S rRNA (uracil1498-N3)-methyltransferase